MCKTPQESDVGDDQLANSQNGHWSLPDIATLNSQTAADDIALWHKFNLKHSNHGTINKSKPIKTIKRESQ